MPEHFCHADGCTVPVPRRMFMCKAHWFALPKPLRDRIWATYVPGQEQRGDPSQRYLMAAREAIDFLKAKEGSQ